MSDHAEIHEDVNFRFMPMQLENTCTITCNFNVNFANVLGCALVASMMSSRGSVAGRKKVDKASSKLQ